MAQIKNWDNIHVDKNCRFCKEEKVEKIKEMRYQTKIRENM